MYRTLISTRLVWTSTVQVKYTEMHKFSVDEHSTGIVHGYIQVQPERAQYILE
jgi:hypothetical protein